MAELTDLIGYDFMRCDECKRIHTKPEMIEALKTGNPCPCGCKRVSPTNLPWWGWLLPRVWTFAIARLRGKE